MVIGTAGHIDHGKTSLLRALTGIDADRLPEERRRGMTIDVGYAHVALPDGSVVDFVDVPGHDRLVGNMLVGAGEIDAALLVVAADDGPNAQTLEHLGLLDALGIRDGLAVVTKADLVDEARLASVEAEVGALLATTTLAGSPVLAASATNGTGIDAVLAAVAALARRLGAGDAAAEARGPRLAIDRVFAVKGRGTVVTGSLRGGAVTAGTTMRLVPGDDALRIREVQVRGAPVDRRRGWPHGPAGRRDRGRPPAARAGPHRPIPASSPRRGSSSPCAGLRRPRTDARPTASACASTWAPRRPRRWWCAGRARRSTSTTGPRSRSCASTRPSPPPRATGSPSAGPRPARWPAGASCSTRCRHAASRAGG